MCQLVGSTRAGRILRGFMVRALWVDAGCGAVSMRTHGNAEEAPSSQPSLEVAGERCLLDPETERPGWEVRGLGWTGERAGGFLSPDVAGLRVRGFRLRHEKEEVGDAVGVGPGALGASRPEEELSTKYEVPPITTNLRPHPRLPLPSPLTNARPPSLHY